MKNSKAVSHFLKKSLTLMILIGQNIIFAKCEEKRVCICLFVPANLRDPTLGKIYLAGSSFGELNA